jgi:hypothetical protein
MKFALGQSRCQQFLCGHRWKKYTMNGYRHLKSSS